MQRITITIDDDLLETIDKISAQRGYASRSETLRDLVRDAVTRAADHRWRSAMLRGPCLRL